MTTDSNTTETKTTKRPKRSLAERRAALQAQIAILDAKEDGTYEMERSGLKAVKFALRRRETEKHNAEVLINGRASTAKSPALATIAEKVANAETRLASLKAGQERAQGFLDNLPTDIELLQGLVTLGEAGETVEVPDGLYQMEMEDKTEVEVEVAASITQAEEN